MAKGSLFIGWGAIIPGREKTAAQVLGESFQYLQRLQGEGVIENFDVVLLEPHGGDLEGFVLIKGDKDTLARLRMNEDFLRVIISVQLVHSRVGVVGAHTGSEMQGLLQLWDQQESKLL